jgi:Predicted Zn-dependent hydrolases of the beta-lactamase fold
MSDITWFGHSAFKISAPGAQVIIDPFLLLLREYRPVLQVMWILCW